MTTVRQLLEHGNPEYAMKALGETSGQTPLCCFRMRDLLVTCSRLRRFHMMKVLDRRCCSVRKEMTEKLGTYTRSPGNGSLIASPLSLPSVSVIGRR